MLGLSANLNYYLFNGNVDLRKGVFRLCESIREEMSLDPSDASNVYMFMSRNRKVVKILHYERGFYVLYMLYHIDKMMLRKRYIIETINDLLKNKAQLVHSRHRSITNFLMNLVAVLGAYCFFENKPDALQGYCIEDSKQLSLF